MLNLQGLSARTININEAVMINANLAKVMISTTGNVDADDIAESVCAKLQGQGALVEGSLTKVQASEVGDSYVAFVKSVSEVREVDNHELQASYHAVLATNSNVLVNNEDQSVWELKTGSAGKYLVRHQEEDLSSLVTAAANESELAPRLAKVSMAVPEREALVAYVTETGDVDYGFVTKTSQANQNVELISVQASVPRVVSTRTMLSAHKVDLDPEIYRMAAATISESDKDKMRKFYTALYSIAPDYLSEVIDEINAL